MNDCRPLCVFTGQSLPFSFAYLCSKETAILMSTLHTLLPFLWAVRCIGGSKTSFDLEAVRSSALMRAQKGRYSENCPAFLGVPVGGEEREKHKGSAGLGSQELLPEVAVEAVSGIARHVAIEVPCLASCSSHYVGISPAP